MIELEHGGISSRMTLEELEPFIERLDRKALIRLVLRLAAQIHHMEAVASKEAS